MEVKTTVGIEPISLQPYGDLISSSRPLSSNRSSRVVVNLLRYTKLFTPSASISNNHGTYIKEIFKKKWNTLYVQLCYLLDTDTY